LWHPAPHVLADDVHLSRCERTGDRQVGLAGVGPSVSWLLLLLQFRRNSSSSRPVTASCGPLFALLGGSVRLDFTRPEAFDSMGPPSKKRWRLLAICHLAQECTLSPFWPEGNPFRRTTGRRPSGLRLVPDVDNPMAIR